MKAVFLDQQTFIPSIDLSVIAQQVKQLECFSTTSYSQIIERASNAQIIITNKVPLDKNILNSLPHLKLICLTATGMNNVDLTAAANLNIKVMNVSGYSTNSVSQYVFAQLLQYFTAVNKKNQQVKDGLWSQSATFCLHHQPFNELAGKTIGILGFGNLGKKIASIAQAFDMNVLISERPTENTIRNGRVSFQNMLKHADIISIHCPLTDETKGLFSKSVFAQMQKHAILINTARGAIIDNIALKQALEDENIAAAILDVLDQEPPSKEHILLQAQPANLFITAHIAWASKQAQQRSIDLVAQNIAAYNKTTEKH